MKRISTILLMLLVGSFVFSCNKDDSEEYADVSLDPDKGIFAKLETNHGNILIKLFEEDIPITVDNFIDLAEGKKVGVDSIYKGKPFYDGTIFHRVIDGFMIQGGSPDGKPNGGPGYTFEDEIKPKYRHNAEGVVSMANSGPNTNGSQFFITVEPTPWLDFVHTVFGRVIEGMDVVKEISKVKVGKDYRPVEDVILNKVTIIRKGETEEES